MKRGQKIFCILVKQWLTFSQKYKKYFAPTITVCPSSSGNVQVKKNPIEADEAGWKKMDAMKSTLKHLQQNNLSIKLIIENSVLVWYCEMVC